MQTVPRRSIRLARMVHILTPCHSLKIFHCTKNDSKALQLPRIVLSTLTRGRSYMIVVKPPSPITDYLTCFPAAALDPVTMTLSDVQTHLHVLTNSSTILLGQLLESDLYALQLSYLRCIGTAILFYHPRGRPLKPGLT
ncbi:hypothetical protein EDB89DRAFT_1296406 [Lactarius sanguifluus]|nr:hypothetical protein EDB89DRAFT_1296406 [Lactarius sanguifluus]